LGREGDVSVLHLDSSNGSSKVFNQVGPLQYALRTCFAAAQWYILPIEVQRKKLQFEIRTVSACKLELPEPTKASNLIHDIESNF